MYVKHLLKKKTNNYKKEHPEIRLFHKSIIVKIL